MYLLVGCFSVIFCLLFLLAGAYCCYHDDKKKIEKLTNELKLYKAGFESQTLTIKEALKIAEGMKKEIKDIRLVYDNQCEATKAEQEKYQNLVYDIKNLVGSN